MARDLPLTPLLLCVIGAGLVLFGGYMLATVSAPAVNAPLGYDQGISEAQNTQALIYHDPMKASGSVTSIQTKSPFARDRGAYSRSMAVSQTQSSAIVYKPKFVGTLGRADRVRAMIIWNPNEPAEIFAVGERTPAGTLISITSLAIVLENEGEQTELKLF